MSDTNSYILLLIESLGKKNKILDQIIRKNQQQNEILSQKNVSFDTFDQNVAEKRELIQQLNQIDEGFQAVYDRVKEELQSDKTKFKDQIVKMQELIQQITDKSVSIQTMEKRNKKRIEDYFQYTRKEMRQVKMSTTAASNYYKSMNQSGMSHINSIDEKK